MTWCARMPRDDICHVTLTNSLLESAAFTRSIALGIMLRDAKDGTWKIARRRRAILGFSVVSIASAICTRLCISRRGLGDGGAGGWVAVLYGS